MEVALLALVAFQSPPWREMREGLERKYRVSVVQEAGDEYAYRLRIKVTPPSHAKAVGDPAKLLLELRMTDYRATVGEQKLSAPLVGGGQTPVEPTGLPRGLNVTGPQGPVWLPVLAFYLPAQKEDAAFSIPPCSVAPGLDLTGKGTLAKSEGSARITLDASLVSAGSSFGKLTIVTTLDPAGWPAKAEGTLVSDDGTYRFTVARG